MRDHNEVKLTNLNKMLLIPVNHHLINRNKVLNMAFESNEAFGHLYELEALIAPIMEEMQETGLLVSKKWLSEGLLPTRNKLKQFELDLNNHIGVQASIFDEKLVYDFWKAKGLPKANTREDYGIYEHFDPTYKWLKEIYKKRQFLAQWDAKLKLSDYEAGNNLRIRGQWRSFSTWSGRLIAKELPLVSMPNIMNSYVVPPANHKVIALDLSNAEVRALAYHSKCGLMIDEINRGVDHHSLTGDIIKNVVQNNRIMDDASLRSLAKTYTYGSLYGASTETLINNLRKNIPGITSVEVCRIKKAHDTLYPELEHFLRFQEQSDSLLTPFGKVKPLVRLSRSQKRNFSLQSTVAVLIKILMVVVHQYFQVIHVKHDELWFVAPSREPTTAIINLIEKKFISQVQRDFPGYPIQDILMYEKIGGQNND